MPVLIAPGLNGDDGAHSAPTAHIGEPTLPRGGKWDSGDTAAPPPPQHSSKVQIPGDPTWGRGVKYHLKMASYNPSVLNLLLNQVARCVLSSGKKTVKKRYGEGHCVVHGLLRKEAHCGTLREVPSMPGYISPPVPAMAAGGPSRCQGRGPLHFLKVRPLGGWGTAGTFNEGSHRLAGSWSRTSRPSSLVFCVLPFCILREDPIL